MKRFFLKAGHVLLALVLMNFMAYMLVRCFEDEARLDDHRRERRMDVYLVQGGGR